MSPDSSPTSRSSIRTGTPGLKGFLDVLVVGTGLQLRHATGAGWPTSKRGNESAVDFRTSEPSERPMAKILFPPSVDEKARDVNHTPSRGSPCITRTPEPSDQAYRTFPSPTTSVWQAGEKAKTEQ